MDPLTFSTGDADPNWPGDGKESGHDDPLFVRRMCQGAQSEHCMDDPEWQQIEDALRALDGTDDIMLEGPGPYPSFPYLVVGGRNGRYLVVAGQEENVLVLSDPDPQDSSEFLVFLGGQASVRPAHHAVDIEAALAAAHAFARRGIMTSALRPLRWVKDF